MNRTPREILWERHRAAEGRLDAVRERVLARALSPSNASSSTLSSNLARLSIRIWKELFWSCRRIWTGLAAAWLVIIAVNFLSLDEAPATQSGRTDDSVSVWTFLLEQKRLLAELGEVEPTPPPAKPPVAPRPRSEYRPTNRARC